MIPFQPAQLQQWSLISKLIATETPGTFEITLYPGFCEGFWGRRRRHAVRPLSESNDSTSESRRTCSSPLNAARGLFAFDRVPGHFTRPRERSVRICQPSLSRIRRLFTPFNRHRPPDPGGALSTVLSRKNAVASVH